MMYCVDLMRTKEAGVFGRHGTTFTRDCIIIQFASDLPVKLIEILNIESIANFATIKQP